jgi:hypothetical protein
MSLKVIIANRDLPLITLEFLSFSRDIISSGITDKITFDVMDLYAIHKSFLDLQSDLNREASDSSSDLQKSRNSENMAQLSKMFNMAFFKGIMPSNRQATYDVTYDSSDSVEDLLAPLLPFMNNDEPSSRPSSTEFNPSLLLPFGGRGGSSSQNTLNSANHSGGSSRVTLADQFT